MVCDFMQYQGSARKFGVTLNLWISRAADKLWSKAGMVWLRKISLPMSIGIYNESEQSFVNGIGRITWQQPWFLCLNCCGTHQNVQGCATKEYKDYFWMNSWEHFQDDEHSKGPDLNFVPDIGWVSRSSSFGEWFHSQPGLQLWEPSLQVWEACLPDNRCTILDELVRNNDLFHFFFF